jgi:hypothetical protein
MSLYRSVVGLIIGGLCGGVVGLSGGWLVSWLRENPQEPAWIFAGTVFGLFTGLVGGSALGLVVGLLSDRSTYPMKRL